jgi:subtilisin family serine protease
MQPDRYERFRQQLAEIRAKQAPLRFDVWPPGAEQYDGVAPEYVYERARMLCHTGPDELVRNRLGISAVGTERLPRGLSLVSLPDGDSVQERVRQANAESPPDQPLATPNHLVSITPVNICPADEPVPVAIDAPPWPPRAADANAGRGITVLVIDTGIIRDVFDDQDYRDSHPWLHGIQRPGTPDTVTRTDSFESPTPALNTVTRTDPFQTVAGVRLIKEYAGHGTFVSGVIGCVAPGATIRAHHALEKGGALRETELGQILLDVLEKDGWPDIINLSAGSPTMGGLPLKGLEPFMAELAKHEDTLLVAAAGNDAKRDNANDRAYHFWPAAYAPSRPGIVSVAALRRAANGRACFTNYGSSVTVYARGEEHVNAFLRGEYEYHHGTDPACHNYRLPEHNGPLYCPCSCVTSLPYHGHGMFQGMARWSGTSFAAPLVAGMVAAYMSANPGVGSRQAFDALFKQAQSIHDVADGEPLHAFL